MAKKNKRTAVVIPPPSPSPSSSEEEEDEQEQQHTDSSNTIEVQHHTPQSLTSKPLVQEDNEDEDNDEPEPEPGLKKPCAQNPKSESSNSESSDSCDMAASVSAFTVEARNPKSVSPKRASKRIKEISSKKKQGGEKNVDKGKKSIIIKVWTEDDEIILLEKLMAYKVRNGSVSGFYETINDLNVSLKVVTYKKVYEKVRGLRRKYHKYVNNGVTVFPEGSFEQRLFQLSEKIWGGEDGGVEQSGTKTTRKAVKKKLFGKEDMVKMGKKGNDVKKDGVEEKVVSLYPCLSKSLELEAAANLPMMCGDAKDFAKKLILEFDEEKAKELETEWNEYAKMECILYAKRLKLMHNQAEAVLDVIQHSEVD